VSLVKGLGHPLTYMRKTTEDAREHRESASARARERESERETGQVRIY
jgi:hypothetical protein